MITMRSLFIVDSKGRLLVRKEGNPRTLPQVEVENGRLGLSLARALRTQLQLEILRIVTPSTLGNPIDVLRLQSEGAAIPRGYVWIDASDIIVEGSDSLQLLAFCSADDGDFGRYRWYSEVQAWLAHEIAKCGYTIRSIEQWNGGISGVLLSVSTDGPRYWFKAANELNTCEAMITQMLAARHPDCFPRVVASAPWWKAILIEHIQGEELFASDALPIWIGVTKRLAEVQLSWVGKADQLLAAGAADLRACALASKIPHFIKSMAEIMSRQPKTSPARLEQWELDELVDPLYVLCAEVDSLPFATGVASADFSPHNTLITKRGPVFIDWAEACVSLPLITGEYLWNRMIIESPERSAWAPDLHAAYVHPWTQEYEIGDLNSALSILPAFSIFAAANFYLHQTHSTNGREDPYLRALTRKLRSTIKQLVH